MSVSNPKCNKPLRRYGKSMIEKGAQECTEPRYRITQKPIATKMSRSRPRVCGPSAWCDPTFLDEPCCYT